LGHTRLQEFSLAEIPAASPDAPTTVQNLQTPERFTAEAEQVKSASTKLVWRRPSDRDPDRANVFEIVPSESGGSIEAILPLGGGQLRGILLHKIMEELLNEELAEDKEQVEARARILITQLAGVEADSTSLPDSTEVAATAWRTLQLPDIARLRPYLIA